MAKKWLKTKSASDVAACNSAPYGYPAKGTTLPGGVASSEPGGVGWTVEQFPVEESDTLTSFVVQVDDTKVPEALKPSLLSTKPATKPAPGA